MIDPGPARTVAILRRTIELLRDELREKDAKIDIAVAILTNRAKESIIGKGGSHAEGK